MPIDPAFQAHSRAGPYANLRVWKGSDSNLGIYGTSVAVDFDLCTGDGACIEVCPAGVFEWHGNDANRKAIPNREADCTFCFGCEAVCPRFAIRVTPVRK